MVPDKCNVLITGVNGFVGSALYNELSDVAGINVTGTVRNITGILKQIDTERFFCTGDLSGNTDFSKLVMCQDVIIHTAARAHVMGEGPFSALDTYRIVNVDATLKLARQAAEAGVKRFIYVSSIKVNGEQTRRGHPFTASDKPLPEDAYGVSKMEAEQQLRILAQQTKMELVIIRPPLVYGPNVKGNFVSLLKLIKKGLPLPLGGLENQRSFVAIRNLLDLVIVCIKHPRAANETFLVADAEDVSTSELINSLSVATDRKAYLFYIPPFFLRFCMRGLGKKAIAERLLGSLQVDISKNKAVLGWVPPYLMADELSSYFGNADND